MCNGKYNRNLLSDCFSDIANELLYSFTIVNLNSYDFWWLDLWKPLAPPDTVIALRGRGKLEILQKRIFYWVVGMGSDFDN